MPSKLRRAIFTVQKIENPISLMEIDIALTHAEKEYGEFLNVDLLRTTFNTVQALREDGIVLPLLVKVVVRENILESNYKKMAYVGAIMCVYNHRGQVKAGANEKKAEQGLPVTPAIKQTEHPTEFIEGRQRVLF